MSAFTRRLREWRGTPLVLGWGAAAGLALFARSQGLLEGLELDAYDVHVRARPAPPLEGVVLVSITEDDLRRLGRWPIDDAHLARLLRSVASGRPAAIGLDLYRDLGHPPGTDSLEAALREIEELVAIELWPEALGTPGPPALAGTGRVAPANVVRGIDGVVRRAILGLTPTGEPTRPSLAMALASRALQRDALSPLPDALADWVPGPMSPTAGGYWWAEPSLSFEGPDGTLHEAWTHQVLIDFGPVAGEGPALVTYPAGDVLDGRVAPSAFSGRVVVIGSSTGSVQDTKNTPVGVVDGPVLQALVTAQLVAGAEAGVPPIGSWSNRAEVGWVLLWCALGALLATGVRSTPLLGVAALVGLGVAYLLTGAAFERGVWIPLAAPSTGWVSAAGLTLALSRSSERRSRRALMELFSRHVSPRMAEEMWRRRDEFMDGARPRPARVPVTVLFADLRGYTSAAETTDPVVLLEWLDRFLGVMADEIMRHGGRVNDYFGDGIMATFGAPFGHPDGPAADAAHALDCARAMADRLRELNGAWLAAGQRPAAMRIGIKSGEGVTGSVGSRDQLKYAVVGDVVNTAARLEAFSGVEHDFHAEPVRVLASAETIGLVGDIGGIEYLGAHALKGKQAPVDIYKVRLAPEAEVGP